MHMCDHVVIQLRTMAEWCFAFMSLPGEVYERYVPASTMDGLWIDFHAIFMYSFYLSMPQSMQRLTGLKTDQ